MKYNSIVSILVIIVMIFSGFLTVYAGGASSGALIVTSDTRASDDSYEENDNSGSASTVFIGNYSNLWCLDDDWYRIRLTAGNDLSVTITFDHSSGDLDLELYDTDAVTLLSRSETDSDTELVSKSKISTPGFYYIRVYGYRNATNGYSMKLSTMDITPPQIAGKITLTHLSSTSVQFQWTTDEPCFSFLGYGMKAGHFYNVKSDASLVATHSLTLTDLEEFSTHNYRITSRDRYGNEAESGVYYFTTLPGPDTVPPEIELIAPESAREPAQVIAEVNDNKAVERVEFYLDGVLQNTDFSAVFDWLFDPAGLPDGAHTLAAKAYDTAGNSAFDEKTVRVINPVPDRTPPEIRIISELTDSKVKGGIYPIRLNMIDDDSGIKAVAFYVDGEHLGTNFIGGESGSLEETAFNWNTIGEARKQWHTVSVKAYDNEGLSSEDSMDVFVEAGNDPIAASSNDIAKVNPIKVTRGQVRHEGLHYEVIFYVKNIGKEKLYEVNAFDYNYGFQTMSSAFGYLPWASYDPATRCSTILFRLDTLMPGEVKTCTYNMVPVLFAPDPRIDFTIGKKTVVDFKEDTGNLNFVKHTTVHYVPSVEMLPSWWAVNPVPITWQNILPDMINSDYIITTHPENLYLMDPNTYGVDELLSDMAKFSEDKNGVLGYLTSWGGNIINELRNAIEPQYIYNFYTDKIHQGAWNHYVTPNWENTGYLLIVGEVEVVPSVGYILTVYNADKGENVEHEIPQSDHYYADLLGDGAPDVIVGRLIGDSGLRLAEQLKTSMGVHNSEAGYDFDGSNALLVSGVGNYYDGFIEQVDNIGDTLTAQNVFAYRNHWKDYIAAKSIPRDFDYQFGLAVGNLGGNSLDEILVADHNDGKIYVYNADGTLHHSVSLGFSAGDALTVGDIDGDGIDEIIHGIASQDRINIHKAIYLNNGNAIWGSLGGFNAPFDPNDGLAVGDVRFDSKEEIVVADVSAGKVYIYDNTPTLKGSFTKSMLPFENHQGFAIGNVVYTGPGIDKEEIVMAGLPSHPQRIYTLDGYGFEKQSFDSNWKNQDSLAVGNIFWSGIQVQGLSDEIIIRNSTDNTIWGINGNSDYNFKVPVHFRAAGTYDILATGNLIQGDRNEIVYADRSDDMIYYFDDLWGARMNAAFKAFADNKDLIYWGGHGYPEGWGAGVSIYNLPADFDGTNPFVMAMSCSTGLYDYIDDNGQHQDLSIAEQVLYNGAGVYIGATRMTNTGTNKEGGMAYYKSYWNPGLTVGNSYNNLERDAWSIYKQTSTLGATWWRWVLAYNIYGDPKYKIVENEDTPDFNLPSLKTLGYLKVPGTGANAEPLAMEIPEYIVSNESGLKNVDIPGGGIKIERDQVRIPFYFESMVVPEGYRVADVILKDKTGLKTERGLNLIRVTTDDIVTGERIGKPPAAQLEPGLEWYPYEEFSWKVRENPNGTSTMDIIVYPFQYNLKTNDSRFYSNFDFDISLVKSDVEIKQVQMDNLEYEPGDIIEIEVTLDNHGSTAKDIILFADLRYQKDTAPFRGLPLESLSLQPGTNTEMLKVNTGGTDPGLINIEIVAMDQNGNSLDSDIIKAVLGVVQGRIDSFKASPAMYLPGEMVEFSLKFKNTGSEILDGTAVITVEDTEGSAVQEFSENISGLAPGNEITISRIWDSTDHTGKYYALAVVYYDSRTELSEIIEIKDISETVQSLIESVGELDPPLGLRKSLEAKLENAIKSIENGQYKTAVNQLTSFINEVEAHRGKIFTDVEADDLINFAQQIINGLNKAG